ncbi:hypothetical protein [Pseudonocardia alaniniphila]|uniref:Uncharacterized protein n=1 Tax=Pseudonocardia alaniniphila TaxID=75291 RepID=A0ABS9T7I9_9PSEU|nr:hypothetical protein [Pseudonocardia alaniniphila]MCH6164492.1 hypothetical protein [Pseudonocardia alaniniphila]
MSHRDPLGPDGADAVVGRRGDLDRIRVLPEAPDRERPVLPAGEAGAGHDRARHAGP